MDRLPGPRFGAGGAHLSPEGHGGRAVVFWAVESLLGILVSSTSRMLLNETKFRPILMNRIITIGSQKGGVGKTTTALNLGFSLGRFGVRTLVVDLDPQSGTTIAVNLRNFTDKGIVDVLHGDCPASSILAEANDGSMTLAGIGRVDPMRMQTFEQCAWEGTLTDLLRRLAADYQYTIIDAPGGLGGIVQAALAASDGTILVCNCSAITLKSLPDYLKLVDYVADRSETDLCLEGVLLSMVDERSQTEQEIFEKIRQLLPEEAFFQTVIPYHEDFARANLEAVPAALIPEAREISRLFLDLAMELRERERTGQQTGDHDGPRQLF